jgi:hypothetical protein
MALSEGEIIAIKCAHADLKGSLEAHEACDRHMHDWKAHQQSIKDLEAAFPDILNDRKDPQLI